MQRKRILLVDDSKTVLLMERMILQQAYDLTEAQDGQEGLEKAQQDPPDLILMDVIMPRLNGFEACKRIRAGANTAGVPIILVTTRGEADTVRFGREAGANDHVTKPINGAELLAKVRRHLGE